MRILIVGGRSSLAHALIPVLREFAEVVTAGRGGCDVQLDLMDPPEKMQIPERIDVVINAAAAFGGKSFEQIFEAENVNALGVLKLCQSCSKGKIKQLILISSIFACLDEKSAAYSIYSLSKRHSEELASLYSATVRLPITILRPSQLYGVGHAYRRHQPFLYNIIDKAANDQDIVIYGSNDAQRNYIHVEDVANIVALVVKRGILGTYACMNGENVRYSDVGAAAIKAFGSKSAVRFLRQYPDIPDNVCQPDDSLFRVLGYYPQISIALGMQKEAAYRRTSR